MMRCWRTILPALGLFLFLTGCQEQKEHIAPAIHDRDSVDVMTSYGVNTLVSDSGVIKYRIVAERWTVNEVKNPSRWSFEKGIFMEAFDENFHVYSYVQADTAYYYDQRKLWNLRGRVRILTKDGLRFASNEIFWDMNSHEIYSFSFSRLVTPDRTLQGTYFKSDEQMTKYVVSNTRGSFSRSDFEDAGGSQPAPSDTAAGMMRPRMTPMPKSQP
ncbi:LPS export ABC transporter periplasmic protein LptC [Prevotella sp. AGR2160]|uniref:LPS export ABC transporter periplasmic protein LptC n=1 Tax=Prevotella sp. AGR2160 TaxID=1280674 RepID=UPI00042229C2